MEKNKEKSEKVLMVRVPVNLHTETKVMASKKRQSLSIYVRRALVAALEADKEQGL